MGCLRLFLAISVLVAHAGPLFGSTLAGGPPAVQAFFAISGFYMALVLTEKYAPGRRGTAAFWLNRLLRLGPTYALVLVVTVVYVMWHRADAPFFRAMAMLNGPWQAIVWTVNTIGVGLDAILFSRIDPAHGTLRFAARPDVTAATSATHLQLVPQGWSLALELYFYALAPWLVRLRTRWLLAVIAASVSVRLTLAGGFGLTRFPFYYQFFPSELATFLLGAVAYRGYRRLGRYRPLARRFGGWAFVAVVGFAFVWLHLPVPARSLGFAAFVALCVPVLFEATKTSRLDRLVGELSYPLYLAHGLILTMLGPVRGTTGVVLPISLVVATVIVVALEWPIDRLRQRVARKASVSAPQAPSSVAPEAFPVRSDAGV